MTYSLSPMYGANANSCIPITVCLITSVESALLTNVLGEPNRHADTRQSPGKSHP